MTSLSLWTLAGIAVRCSAVLMLTSIVALLSGRRSASLRHAIWSAGLFATLIVPLGSVLPLPALIRLPSIERLPSFAQMPGALNGRALSRDVPVDDRRSERSASATGQWQASENNRLQRISLAEWIVILWATGGLFLVVRLVVSHRAAASLVRSSTAIGSVAIRGCWEEMRKRASRAATLRESSEVGSPATVGIWRHTVLLPLSASSWDPEALRMVLQHEMAHVRRHDSLVDLLGALACAAHWYNPLIWSARRALTRERERAADDQVLAAGAPPHAYAELLVTWARLLVAAPPRVFVLAFAGTTELESRVRAIVGRQVTRREIPSWAAALCLMAGVTASTVAATVQVQAAELPSAGAPVHSAATPVDLAQRLPSPEPDRLGDSVSAPQSERLAPLTVDGDAELMRRAAERLPEYLAGQDSALAAALAVAMVPAPQGSHDLVRERAAWALMTGRRGRLIEPLVDALAHENWRVRAHAAWALAASNVSGSRDARLLPRLAGALDDPVWRVRAAAAYALRGVADSSVDGRMIRALGDAAWQVRASAVEHLAGRRDNASRVALAPLVNDRHIVVREAALAALAPPAVH